MFDSSDSRRAAEFDSYRRELVLHSRTVSGESREAWFNKLQELVSALFPDSEVHARKPGLATRLFSLEVALPNKDKMHLLDLATELDDNWRSMIKPHVKGGASCVYRDRLDAIWEWVVDLGDAYVTGHVKLRNFSFENPTRHRADQSAERPWRRHQESDRDRFNDRPSGDRPYQKRPYGSGSYDRPKPDRYRGGDRDRDRDRPTYDRSQGPSDGSRESWKPRKPFGSGSAAPRKGYPKFGPAKKGPGRPKHRPSDG